MGFPFLSENFLFLNIIAMFYWMSSGFSFTVTIDTVYTDFGNTFAMPFVPPVLHPFPPSHL